MPQLVEITGDGCRKMFVMATLAAKCGGCGMVYGVTPCYATDADGIKDAGVDD